MPIYEYRCRSCENPFERYARTFDDRPDCPACGTSDVARQISIFAVSNGADQKNAAAESLRGGCGEGPPCGASQCGRLAN